jgi:uncharacterized membrane protein YcaP (DUF421 family)
MESVLRAATIYFVLLVLFRIAGRRTLSELTAFDFVLLLIIGDATQQALLAEDYSLTNAVIVVTTILFIDVVLSLIKVRSPGLDRIIDGVPTIIVENGRPLHDRMRKARVSESDVLEAARRLRGIERLDQVRYAVIEVSGGITVIPRREGD